MPDYLVHAQCACLSEKALLDIYDDDHGRALHIWTNTATLETTERVSTIRTVKVRCNGCDRVYLTRLPLLD